MRSPVERKKEGKIGIKRALEGRQMNTCARAEERVEIIRKIELDSLTKNERKQGHKRFVSEKEITFPATAVYTVKPRLSAPCLRVYSQLKA